MRRLFCRFMLNPAALALVSCGGDGEPSTGTTPQVASVIVSPGEITLEVGKTEQLTATAHDEADNPLTGRSIIWSSTDQSLARVSSTGLVTGVSAGAATISATAEGKTGTAAVAVIAVEAPVLTFTSVATGGAHTCALTASGAAWCWGRGESGQLGIPTPTTTCTTDAGPVACSRVPVPVGGGATFTALTGGGAHTCGLTSDGSAYCWGSNSSGQLGDNSATNREAPTAVATQLKFVSIDAGARHTCALTLGGVAYCWGVNNKGQLGNSTVAGSLMPTAVTGDHTFQMITAGGFSVGHTCGLTPEGVAYCWGDNERGQLGNGLGGFGKEDLNPYPIPAPVSGIVTFTALTAGPGRHTCGLSTEGAAYCWGENSFGALGDGTTTDRSVPVAVSGGVLFAKVIAGGYIGHTCGVTPEGILYCWGEGSVGQIGDNTTSDRLAPTAVSGGLSFTDFDAGFRHTCALATTGTLYCWGSGGAGQLGLNSTNPSPVPAKVVGQP